MKSRIIECLGNIGVIVDEDCKDSVELSELIHDSLTFITMIIELENTFDIEIPDMYLSYDAMHTLDDVIAIVNKLQMEVN